MSRLSKLFIVLCLAVFFINKVVAEEDVDNTPVMSGAELFGLPINNLSQEMLEDKLAEMGVKQFANAQQFKVKYNLGERDVLGIHQILVEYNDYYFVTKIILYGKIESPGQRKKLGNLLVKRYQKPMAGEVKEGYGRAQWRFNDGTMIELNNKTFDVRVVYRDLIPSKNLVAGEVDVQALKDNL